MVGISRFLQVIIHSAQERQSRQQRGWPARYFLKMSFSSNLLHFTITGIKKLKSLIDSEMRQETKVKISLWTWKFRSPE